MEIRSEPSHSSNHGNHRQENELENVEETDTDPVPPPPSPDIKVSEGPVADLEHEILSDSSSELTITARPPSNFNFEDDSTIQTPALSAMTRENTGIDEVPNPSATFRRRSRDHSRSSKAKNRLLPAIPVSGSLEETGNDSNNMSQDEDLKNAIGKMAADIVGKAMTNACDIVKWAQSRGDPQLMSGQKPNTVIDSTGTKSESETMVDLRDEVDINCEDNDELLDKFDETEEDFRVQLKEELEKLQ